MLKRLLSCFTLMLLAGLLTACNERGAIDMTYTFEGTHASDAGYAEGVITVTPAVDSAKEGYYLLYFANGKGLLAGYDEFASVPITGNAVTYAVKSGTLLPPAATSIAVFESEHAFLDEQPAYTDRIGTVRIPQSKRLRLTDAAYTFGAVADVHMNFEPYDRGPYRKWENALNVFAAEKMDDVIVAGDMTGDESEGTLAAQYTQYLRIINASDYPPDHVYEAIGNHGNTEHGRKQFTEFTGGKDEVHPFEGSPWFSLLRMETARDNLFLFMAQELNQPWESPDYDNFSKEQIDWLESMLIQYADTDTNIFIILHSPFLNYGAGDRHPGGYTGMITFNAAYTQTMRLKQLLETHKSVIVLSGHSHLSLYDNENYSDENGTSCRMIHIGSCSMPNSYCNGDTFERDTDGRHEVTPDYGSEAYTVAVYDEYIIFTGRNLSTGTVIPSACHILPIIAEDTL